MSHLFSSLILAAALSVQSLMPPKDAEPEWDTDIYPQSNIFPSFLIGTARVDLPEELFAVWGDNHLGDPQGGIGITLSGADAGSKVEVVVKENAYMCESRFSGKLEKDAEELLIHPKIAYKYDALAQVSQAVPLNITIAVTVNGKSLGEKTVTTTLRSINDCLFGVEEASGDGDDPRTSDYSWLFAAYVNENHPWVDRILKEALDTGLVSSFTGYQSDDKDEVLLQIFAIWNVMQRHGLKYSDVTTTAAVDNGVYSQHVRLFDESVTASQANCVDGTVLMAAILRKIGLRPSLALIPGHMFLAVDIDDDTTIGLETTLLGEKDLRPVRDDKNSALKKLEEHKNKESWASFESAVSVGTDALKENQKKFDSDDLDYQLIDLEKAREMGILPITYTKKD
ncbi:MAG: hypothetical protein NTV93_14825 [Verrucomicrobia bacterium]|nr:hypothetical protein [Verrucomicrobiota bacterium]